MDLGEDALNFIMLFGVTLFGVIAGGIVPALFGGVLGILTSLAKARRRNLEIFGARIVFLARPGGPDPRANWIQHRVERELLVFADRHPKEAVAIQQMCSGLDARWARSRAAGRILPATGWSLYGLI